MRKKRCFKRLYRQGKTLSRRREEWSCAWMDVRRWVSLSAGVLRRGRQGRMTNLRSSLWSWLQCHFLGEASPDPTLGQVPRPSWWSPPSTSPFIMHNTIAAMSYLTVSSLHWMWDPSTGWGLRVSWLLLVTRPSARDLACSWQAIPRAEWANEWMGHPGDKIYQGHVSPRLFLTTALPWPYLSSSPGYFLFLS